MFKNEKILPFTFLSNPKTTIGNGQVRKLSSILDNYGYKFPLILVDEGFASGSDIWDECLNDLKNKFNSSLNIIQIPGKEPNYNDLRKHVESARKLKSDVVIGLGGGSCMDIAKAVGALLTNPGDPMDYRGFDLLKNPGIPVVCIPTTAGTGSEASFNASFVDEETNFKMGINGKYMFASHAILDGETTLSCPKFPAVGAAIDAIVHTVEGYICNTSNEFSDFLAEKSFYYLINSISDLNNEVGNAEKRLSLLKGAYLAGLVQMNAGGGISSAISYPLGVYYKVPHGMAGGIMLLEMARYNIKNGYNKYKNLCKYYELKSLSTSDELISNMQIIFDELGVPKNLSQFNIYQSDKSELVRVMQTQQKGFDQNPISFNCETDFPKFIDNFLE